MSVPVEGARASNQRDANDRRVSQQGGVSGSSPCPPSPAAVLLNEDMGEQVGGPLFAFLGYLQVIQCALDEWGHKLPEELGVAHSQVVGVVVAEGLGGAGFRKLAK